MKDYYKILQIHPEASLEVMNNAYRTLVRQYHPDLYHSHRKGPMTEKMQDINEAYQVLSNATTRADYDRRYQGNRNQGGQSTQTDSSSSMASMAVIKRMAIWGIGTYLVVKFLLAPFMASPLVKAIVLLGILGLWIRFYARPKR